MFDSADTDTAFYDMLEDIVNSKGSENNEKNTY